ncbi:hypothetical protein KC357_g57 [Hortaea werneckii]|nr:hypothetical protein KC357_g57 [Hortaea werneckii]
MALFYALQSALFSVAAGPLLSFTAASYRACMLCFHASSSSAASISASSSGSSKPPCSSASSSSSIASASLTVSGSSFGRPVSGKLPEGVAYFPVPFALELTCMSFIILATSRSRSSDFCCSASLRRFSSSGRYSFSNSTRFSSTAAKKSSTPDPVMLLTPTTLKAL